MANTPTTAHMLTAHGDQVADKFLDMVRHGEPYERLIEAGEKLAGIMKAAHRELNTETVDV